MTTIPRSPRYAIRKLNLAGCTAVVLALGGVGGWAATTHIAGAVIANGTVVVETSVKKVQHLNGGIVGEILVKEGSEVETGQVLMRLDDTLTRATLGVVAVAARSLYREGGAAARRTGRPPKRDLPRSDPQRTHEGGCGECDCRRGTAIPGTPRGTRGSTRATARTGRSARRGNPRPRRSATIQGQRNQVHRRRDFRRLGTLQEKSRNGCALCAITAGPGAPARRARPIDRRDCPLARQNRRDRAADPPARSGFSHRCAQGPARNPGKDRGTEGARKCGRRRAEAHRYPRAAARELFINSRSIRSAA